MKKLARFAITFILIAVLTLSLFVPVSAAVSYSRSMEIGDTAPLLLSDTPYVSSDESVVKIVYRGSYKYSAEAVGAGYAEITGGTWMGAEHEPYKITVTDPNSKLNNADGANDATGVVTGFRIFAIVLALLVLNLRIITLIFILIAAPKNNMSRGWAFIALANAAIALAAFFVILSIGRRKANRYLICPYCNKLHTPDAIYCDVCGTKIQ